MLQTHCKRCKAEIPVENTPQEQHTVTCPECEAVLPVDSAIEPNNILAPRWSDMQLPKGLRVVPSENELKIIRRWFSGKYIATGIFALFWNGIVLGIFQDLSWFAFVIPHVWVGVGLAYYTLAGFLNSTVIRVDPTQLRIKHGPLPAWGNKKLDPIILRQLYAKRRTHRRKNSVSYTYEVHMITWDGRNRPLLKKLNTPQQALFMEQEIERFLHIKDEPVVGELSDPSVQGRINWEVWQAFAKTNGLTFSSGKLLEAFGIRGNYQGYGFRLSAFRKYQNGPPHTRFIIAKNNNHFHENENQPLTTEDIVKVLEPTHSKFSLRGTFQAKEYGQEISFEQNNIPTSTKYLQFAIGSLCTLIDTYPKIVALGGEAVPILQTIASRKDQSLHPIASQLIQDIAPTTIRLRDQASHLLCRRCLAHSGSHEVELSWFGSAIYYGCRICHQSHDFYLSKSVIAVLDRRMTAEPVQQGDELRINWLPRRELFDFDAIEIVQATDEEVERFAVQVGNDTDPTRKLHYETMQCVVSVNCGLSKNTIRILQHTFGSVAVTEEQQA